jgi:hypothetical protein
MAVTHAAYLEPYSVMILVTALEFFRTFPLIILRYRKVQSKLSLSSLGISDVLTVYRIPSLLPYKTYFKFSCLLLHIWTIFTFSLL